MRTRIYLQKYTSSKKKHKKTAGQIDRKQHIAMSSRRTATGNPYINCSNLPVCSKLRISSTFSVLVSA